MLRLADRSKSRSFRPFRSIAANTGLSAQAVAKGELRMDTDVGPCTSAASTVLDGCRSRAVFFFSQKHRIQMQPQAHDVCEAVHRRTAHDTRDISCLWMKRVGAKSVSHRSRELFARAEGRLRSLYARLCVTCTCAVRHGEHCPWSGCTWPIVPTRALFDRSAASRPTRDYRHTPLTRTSHTRYLTSARARPPPPRSSAGAGRARFPFLL
jgi:hypothetical protein